MFKMQNFIQHIGFFFQKIKLYKNTDINNISNQININIYVLLD